MGIATTTRSSSPPLGMPQNKKPRLFAPQRDEDKPSTAAKVDPTYGQRGAFPGLDEDGVEEQLFYGPADDGLAYLRMVRVEAKGVPNLLVAPTAAKKAEEVDLYAPYQARGDGWYSDGAYVAVPSTDALAEMDKIAELDPQQAYYTALLGRFEDLRVVCSAFPPSSSAQQLEPAVRSLLSNPKPRHWKHALLKSQPAPTLLCSLAQEYVIMGIEVLESLLTVRNLRGGVRHKLGVWAWGLLGRCRDVSEMDSEDVSVLRGLGKKACALLRRLRAGEAMHEIDGEGAEEGGEEDGREEEAEVNGSEDNRPENADAEMDTEAADTAHHIDIETSQNAGVSLEEARTRLLSGLFAGDAAINRDPDRLAMQPGPETDAVEEQVSDAHATLDMIVTIVGECYGQRDLLDGRLAWEEL